jgi:hypothetical protein
MNLAQEDSPRAGLALSGENALTGDSGQSLSTTTNLDVDRWRLKKIFYEVLLGKAEIKDVIIKNPRRRR